MALTFGTTSVSILSAATTLYTASGNTKLSLALCNTQTSSSANITLYAVAAAVGSAVTTNMYLNALAVASAATVPTKDTLGDIRLGTGDKLIAQCATGQGGYVNAIISSIGL